MKLERFYSASIYDINEYLTPLRLHDLCLVDMEGSALVLTAGTIVNVHSGRRT